MLGAWEVASKCNIMDGEKRRFTRDNPIDPFYICMTNENGMGC
jgi:hypothetical protein